MKGQKCFKGNVEETSERKVVKTVDSERLKLFQRQCWGKLREKWLKQWTEMRGQNCFKDNVGETSERQGGMHNL